MRIVSKLCFALLLTVSLAGCWNLEEPDEQAFVLGTGLDFTKDGRFELSSQIVIPAGIGGGEVGSGGGGGGGGGGYTNSFRMMSATGRNIYDAVQNLQTQISRSLFFGHRQTILIGQRMAEHGIGGFIDLFVRNPQSEMRSLIFVIKDAEAKEIFTIKPIFDPIITPTMGREIHSLGLKTYYFRNFLSDALSQETEPMLPALSLNAMHKYVYAGAAILNKDNDLKLAGYLNVNESFYANWIAGRLNRFAITSYISEGDGNVSVKLQSLTRRIRVKMVDQHIHVDVRLTGNGTVVENNTSLDPTKPKDLLKIQDELSHAAQKSVQEMIERVQKQYKTDIFGFGESAHQQHPLQWKTLKPKWKETFPQLEVSVKVKIQCKDPGQSNSSLKSVL